MKATSFSNALKEAGRTHAMIAPEEPAIVVRHGRDGPELPVKTVKVHRGAIIIEY
jgi:hypothetical protein